MDDEAIRGESSSSEQNKEEEMKGITNPGGKEPSNDKEGEQKKDWVSSNKEAHASNKHFTKNTTPRECPVCKKQMHPKSVLCHIRDFHDMALAQHLRGCKEGSIHGP